MPKARLVGMPDTLLKNSLILVTTAVLLTGACGTDTEQEPTEANQGSVQQPAVTEAPAVSVETDVEPLPPDRAIEVGEIRVALAVSTHCGIERLFQPIAGEQWLATNLDTAPNLVVHDGLYPMPESWSTLIGYSDAVDLIIERTAQDTLQVTAAGTTDTITYQAADERVQCD